MTPNKEVELEEGTTTATQTKAQVNFKVVLFNDETHTYDYVVDVLTTCCKISKAQAFKCAVEVDLAGRTIVYYGTKEKCDEVSGKINSFGPDYRMPNSMGSMESAVESF